MSNEIIYTVTDFVAICNQILEVSFGSVQITGELANFKISKNRWIYFDLKDENASLRFFGNVNQLPGPLEDGMILNIRGAPQLHPKFGFSITVLSMQLSGEGTIIKAAQLLEQRLLKEGLFDPARKRQLAYPPIAVGVISSAESAGYGDFIKIINERWAGLNVSLIDVQVQGEKAPDQLVQAIQYFNQHTSDIEVLVIIRGGGSSDDLQAFSHESVTRAVAASRIPTLVAIGHESDISLAEKAADLRASTPSNAAQLLTPDKSNELKRLSNTRETIAQHTKQKIALQMNNLLNTRANVVKDLVQIDNKLKQDLKFIKKNLKLLDPKTQLKRGFVIVKQNEHFVSRVSELNSRNNMNLQFYDGTVEAKPIKIR